jgi:hypothetical protein
MVTTRADVRFARPNIQIYDAHIVDLYQWVCARYFVGVKGAETKASVVKLGSRPNFRTDHAGFPKPVPPRSSPGVNRRKTQHYISIGYGGEGVSQSPLKDQAFSTFLDQNPPFELPPKWNSAFDKTCPAQWPVVDDRAIKRLAKGKLRRTAQPDRRPVADLMAAHPGSGPALQFPSASTQERVSRGNGARSKEARCGVVAGLEHPILAID